MKDIKILVVEDDKETQEFLKIFLSKKYIVDSCNSSEDCYALLETTDYNLILMDIAIRGSKDGLQITKELKSSDRYKHIPVICLSAHVMHHDKSQAFKAGVDFFLEKPVQNKVLLQKIESLLK